MTDSYGNTITLPDAEHAQALNNIIEEAQKTRFGTLSLDARNPDHLLHLTRTLVGKDGDAPYFPAGQRMLDMIQAEHEANGPARATLFELDDPPTNTFMAAAKIVYCANAGAQVTVGGVLTLLERASQVVLKLQIYDLNNNGSLIGESIPIISADPPVSNAVTASGTCAPPGVNISAVLTASYVDAGGILQGPIVDVCYFKGAQAVQSVTVTNPVRLPAHMSLPYIKIGLNRTSDQRNDCDYYYQYGVNGSQPIVGVSVSGSATLSQTLAAAPNFNGYLYLYRRGGLAGGGACIVFAPGSDFTQYVTNQQTGFTWAFPTNTFQAAPWGQDQTIDLDFFMGFNTQSGAAQVRVTSIPSSLAASVNSASIPYLMFVWGCLPAGSMVGTPGGDMAIETIKVGMQVDGGPQNGLMEVTEKWTGWEEEPLVHITDDRGRIVRLTTQHPVMTDAGMRLAIDIAAGDRLMTADGSYVTAASVERVDFNGPVYNLEVKPVNENADEEADGTFVVDGFVVGDNVAQGKYSHSKIQNAEAGPLVLSPEFALDAENAARRAAGLPLTLELSNIATAG